MTEEVSLEFRLKKLDETRNYLLEETKQNDLMSEKCKTTCKYLNYVEHLFILTAVVTGYVSISAFASLVAFPFGFTSSEVEIKICTITAGIKKYKSIIKKNKKKNDKAVLPGKDKLNSIEVLVSKALIDSYISRYKYVSVNSVLRNYYEMIKRSKKSWNFCGIMESYRVTCKKYTANENSSVRKTKQNRLMLSNIKLCCLWQEKNFLLLKIKKLIVFRIINLK